ncbi:MAG: Xaa-Pro dipeptidase [Methanosaeta sp. PtaB.Bin039]|nr:MAG: Xaa-Pro dipeptidase [Methanosaeta sp. PtaB.Bin039]HOT06131.1 Xaa-Pro peptidase family protein [Methanotrichaceae archaeon]HQF15560.1 Xaa-Pro peptidase family protein [Methanotrichaceae archaeon]HQI90296.1 Xaa-Pro peptidase family protein [Methanotrichaceae archaeon]HQJ27737.1 Xaa-Pro peptidase family protein [Methanotrichaceae archaeon]
MLIGSDSQVRDFLRREDLDGFLLVGDSVSDPDLFYLSRFLSSDSFALLLSEQRTILVSPMERGRALAEATVDCVKTTGQYLYREKLQALGRTLAYPAVLRDFLQSQGVNSLGLADNAPAKIYKSLCQDFSVRLLECPAQDWRVEKSGSEVAAIEDVQRQGEGAMAVAVDMIRRSSPRGEVLELDGQPLTSEQVRSALEMRLLQGGCEAVDTIVCGGPEAADPHRRGEGVLPANSPIVIDIFPRSRSSRYFADMTRTVVRGEPSPEVLEMYRSVKEALQVGQRALKPGISGSMVHQAVSQAFLDMGYPVGDERGFIHSTGHGVGLAVHERPSLGLCGEVLRAGNVVTVEPGLYFPGIGGVRLEDLVVISENGHRNLTCFEKSLVV